MPHKHSLERAIPRAAKRLSISADSAEREAQGLPLDPSLSQPYPVPKAWLTTFPVQDPFERRVILKTEIEDKSGGHAGERLDALAWEATHHPPSSVLQWNEPRATSTAASSANGSKDSANAETTVDGDLDGWPQVQGSCQFSVPDDKDTGTSRALFDGSS